MPPRHPTIGRALGLVRRALDGLRTALGPPGPDPLGLVVACSGGPDSVALLGLLHLLAGPDRLALTVGHVDHGLRPASADEARLVEHLAAHLGLTCDAVRLDLAPGPGLAARAREARRAALDAMARHRNAAAVALGHTATDQAETMLLHLTRGAGLEGLAGMAPVDVDTASARVRPLLGLRRDETRALAQRLGLPFVDDPTNEDLDQPRVAIRREVLPVLRRLRGGVELAMAASAERVREASCCIDAWVERELRARRRHEGGRTTFDVARFAEIPAAVRSRWIRSVCIDGAVEPDAVGRRLIESVDAALLEGGRPRAWDLRAGFRLRLQGGRLWVERVAAERPSDAQGPPTDAGPIAE